MSQEEDKIEDLEAENQNLRDARDDLMDENERLRKEIGYYSMLKREKEGGE